MTCLECGVSCRWRLKVAFHDGFLSSSTAYVGSDVVGYVLKYEWTPFANCVRSHILAKHLIGIKVWAVGRQEDQPDVGRVFVDPLSCLPGAVDLMSIHDQS